MNVYLVKVIGFKKGRQVVKRVIVAAPSYDSIREHTQEVIRYAGVDKITASFFEVDFVNDSLLSKADILITR
jgi:signal recognition particle subunit SEC65